MREILFRGKRINNGEWIEGDLLHLHVKQKGSMQILPYINPPGFRTEIVLVDPATVGQYTGHKDELGKKIFEGDVCRDGNSFEADGSCDIGEVKWDNSNASFYFDFCFTWNFNEVEPEKWVIVIGNIHDNPDLLERK